jgi:hypothetical protein
MANYRYRVYNKENEKGACLFPSYCSTKKQLEELASKVPNAVIQKKCGYEWYSYDMKKGICTR